MRNRKEYHKEWYKNNKEKVILRSKEWHKNHPERVKEINKKFKDKTREKIRGLLGNKCANPYKIDHSGFEKNLIYFKTLQIDHINGGGKQEIQSFTTYSQYLYYIIKQLKSGSKDYQLLCPTCNWIKRIVNNER
jgi:hypothetical protein